MSQHVFGLHAVEALLAKKSQTIKALYVQDGQRNARLQAILKKTKNLHIDIKSLSKQDLDQMAEEGNHQGILAVCDETKDFSENDIDTILNELTEDPFILILDTVQDPHNLGACLRSANAAGVHLVIAPKDKAVGLNATVKKVASGAAEVTPFIAVTNLARTLRDLKERGIWLYGLAGDAEQTLHQTTLTGPIGLILGSEGSGLRRLTREHCDGLLKIPMQGSVESLNVSVAAGVTLFEVVRQRFNA